MIPAEKKNIWLQHAERDEGSGSYLVSCLSCRVKKLDRFTFTQHIVLYCTWAHAGPKVVVSQCPLCKCVLSAFYC